MARKELFKIGLRYKYAPETFYISLLQSDGSYKKLDIDISEYMWGYWFAIGQKERVTAEIKQFLRKRIKMRKRLVTFGYFFKDSKKEYVYCSERRACVSEYDIANKLLLYKAYKQQWLEADCKYYIGFTAKLNGKYAVEDVSREYREVDLTRPLKIYVKVK